MPEMSRVVRTFEAERDLPGVLALAIEFESDHEYVVQHTPDGMQLTSLPLPQPIRKGFSLDLSADPWTDGYVAVEDSRVCGFIATSIATWNLRLTIHHFYVDRQARGRGVGRAMMEHALSKGREAGAVMAWVETNNRNHPGVNAYARLGFALCGFDLSLYVSVPTAAGEFALFLSRDLRDERG